MKLSVMIDCVCKICHSPFRVYPSDVRKGGGLCCGVLCRNRNLSSRNRRPAIDRFWEKVNKTEGCWNWTGGTNWDFYGVMKVDGRNVIASRFSWQIHFSPIPAGMRVCHKCDNPRCVRPDHLFLGTDADNSRDMVQKGRQVRGEKNGPAKLTSPQVMSIRREYACGNTTYSKLAIKYSIHRGTIQQIILGKSWRHLLSDAAEAHT